MGRLVLCEYCVAVRYRLIVCSPLSGLSPGIYTVLVSFSVIHSQWSKNVEASLSLASLHGKVLL